MRRRWRQWRLFLGLIWRPSHGSGRVTIGEAWAISMASSVATPPPPVATPPPPAATPPPPVAKTGTRRYEDMPTGGWPDLADCLWGEHEDDAICEDPDEVIEIVLDELAPDLPDTLEIEAFRRMKVHVDRARLLEYVLERLDEDYAGEDTPDTHPTEAMVSAADAFASAVEAEYVPWVCESAGVVLLVDVAEWRRLQGPSDETPPWSRAVDVTHGYPGEEEEKAS